METLIRLILSAIAVLICAYILPGAHVDGFLSALVAAGVLVVVNIILKPILIILTIPITAITLGLFLLFINTFMILIVSWLVPGFNIDGFWWAFAYSFALSIVNSIFEAMQGNSSNNQ
ncbi:phage holin family protein [Reichenbachiella carrageenanivorans]|uniref:Phage holin family protein n=1 Tax=Reichenbachiella carrageenanivorans TaxID=2979869 RepID=A0ABY6CYN3_9BACT|nr:phage holin family protein [Reichenbachiella carrageenanivorans]UXX79026.1 phage holin family protein [Reichenbachiella carrageenanivorans]